MQLVLKDFLYQFNNRISFLFISLTSFILISGCNKATFSAANNLEEVGGMSTAQPPTSREPSNNTPYVPKECVLSDGTVIPHLGTIGLYRSAQSNNCDAIKQIRTCNDGVLSGSASYQYLKCDPTACEFNGKSLAHGESITVYKASSVAYGSKCESESRTCNYGILSGSYTNSNCSVALPSACSFNGKSVAHNESVPAYQTSSVAYGNQCASES
ncbi:MAG: hypothetical protein ACK41T_11275, partial [Pseudobdellovibrio sp.]